MWRNEILDLIKFCMNLNLLKIGLKIFRLLAENEYFKMSKKRVEKEMSYLNNLPEPKTDINRSYNQYLCHNFHLNFLFVFIFNVVALLLFVPTIIWLIVKRSREDNRIVNKSAVFLLPDRYYKVLPESLVGEFDKVYCGGFAVNKCLEKEDIGFVWELIKCKPFSLFFVYKLMLKVSLYRGIIRRYKPSAIITASEYSFTSSILTKYCELIKVEHINVMHGERFLEVRASFFRFSRCYVFDPYYVKIFEILRAYKKQFVVESPPAFKMHFDISTQSVDFKYYLTGHRKKELAEIAENLCKLRSKGFTVKVRPHPLNCTMKIACKYFDNELLEDPYSVSLEDSLSSTKRIVGVDSTVLLQGYLNGKCVVFDDLVYAERLEVLIAYKYILLCRDIDKEFLSNYIA